MYIYITVLTVRNLLRKSLSFLSSYLLFLLFASCFFLKNFSLIVVRRFGGEGGVWDTL